MEDFNLEYYPWYCWLQENYHYLMSQDFNPDFIVQYSSIIAGFISISIPIALGIVSAHTSEYKDREISTSFLREWTYIFQVYFILPICYLSILLLSVGISKGWLIILVMFADLLAIIFFILFLRLVQVYSTDFENYYAERLKREADEIIQA